MKLLLQYVFWLSVYAICEMSFQRESVSVMHGGFLNAGILMRLD